MSVSARAQLADDLTAALPEFKVRGYSPSLDGLTRPTVVLWQSAVTRRDEFDGARVDVEFEAWVLVPQEDPVAAETALDDALGQVIAAWQGITWCTWDRVERGTYDNTWHGYRLTAAAPACPVDGVIAAP